jgi:ribosomal protein L1
MGDDTLGTMRSNQAAMGADLDQVKGDVKRISGRVQENEHIIKRTVERDLGAQDRMKENLDALLADLNKAKPASAKGVYMKKVTLSTTMGPGIVVDQATL